MLLEFLLPSAVPTDAGRGSGAVGRAYALTRLINATPERAFAYLDDHRRLSAHMTRPSWQMAGARMTTTTDAGQGKGVGSVIRMSARMLGIRLSVEEVVTEYEPPLRKVWETIGTPRLLVIGWYRMGVKTEPCGVNTALTISIDYRLPESLVGRCLGYLFAPAYARWCVRQMVADVATTFDGRASSGVEESFAPAPAGPVAQG